MASKVLKLKQAWATRVSAGFDVHVREVADSNIPGIPSPAVEVNPGSFAQVSVTSTHTNALMD